MRLSYFAVFVGLCAACGGTAVVESGAGGGGTASSSQTTATGMSSSVSTGNSSGATGQSSSAETGQASSVASGSMQTVSSSATGPSECDNQGNCGDETSGCIGCSLSGLCAPSYENCAADGECIAFADCAGQCVDQACQDKCAMTYPNGAELYNQLIQCVLCAACFFDCDGASIGCAPPP